MNNKETRLNSILKQPPVSVVTANHEIDFDDAVKTHLRWQCPMCGCELVISTLENIPARCPRCGHDCTL